MDKIDIIWFKRDLRLRDHAPLVTACQSSRAAVLLYILEPSLVQSNHYGPRHWRFVWQSLQDMRRVLQKFNIELWSVYGPAKAVFSQLLEHVEIGSVYSHQETGINQTFRRDVAMADFFKAKEIEWQEFPTNAVQRGLMDRQGWRNKWKLIIDQKPSEPKLSDLQQITLPATCQERLNANAFPKRFKKADMLFQIGGATNAWNTLDDFLWGRSRHYTNAISAPGPSQTGCSRLSPYLAWGNVSIRQVWNRVDSVYDELDWQWPVRSFKSRLRWHCHFIQKFESEPRMEFENLNSGYDDIRTQTDQAKIQAWKAGQTGFPMVDACMRSVKTTGYLNFRMRAMLVSFLTHHLWQPWQAGAQFLGRQFLDFEPGIHYSQFQMQAGTMGVNSIRIYNPVKQGCDHDPRGYFIRTWVPELQAIPVSLIHKPWQLSRMEQQMYNFKLGDDYPAPIIPDINESYHRASEKLWAKKEERTVQRENNRIVDKHVKNRD